MPKGIENTRSNSQRVEFGAENLILDSQGVSGSFYAENVLNPGEGAAGNWAFTISKVGLSFSRNAISGGTLEGDIAVPLFEKPMTYAGYIQQDGYGLEVGIQSHYKTPVFLGEMELQRNSSVAIDIKDGIAYPSANLSGQLSILGDINHKEGDPSPPTGSTADTKGFHFPGIVFQNLKLETEPGKKPISAKYFGFDGEMKLMNFPASIEKLELVTPKNQAGLAIGLKVNLDGEGSHATTALTVMGKLDNGSKIHKWKFEKVSVEAIKIDYEKSGISLKGGLEIMEGHKTYGDGFQGELTATIKSVNLKVNGQAIFGVTDFRYWNVDVWAKNNDKSATKFLINSLVGGVSYHMKKTSGNLDGLSPASAVYTPDVAYGLNMRAGVAISTQNSDTFSGKAYLEMEYNSHGGLNKIGFVGEGAFMGDNTSGDTESASFGALNKTFAKMNDYYEKNKKQVDGLAKKASFLNVAKEAIPVHDVAASGKIGAYVGIEKDFVNQTFDGEFELYMDLEGVKGGGENNLAGYAKMHTGPEDWYIYIGTPQKRIELLFQIGVQLRVGGYFMTGTQLPAQLDPHPMVVKILGEDMLNGNRKENQLDAGKGFAFGMNFGYGYNFDYLIFYALVELGAGFDVMHAHYPDATCIGRPGTIGNDGWYSMGQVYAYLYGEFGVKVDLSFIKGKFPIAEAGVAAMLRGQFPNPVYIQGYVGMYYKILGGLVSGRMRLKVAVGEECELANINNAVGVPMISDVTPQDKSNAVSVFTAPQAVFNYASNSDFSVELEEKRRTFQLRLSNFQVKSEGKEIKGSLHWNDTNDAVTFKPDETLPSEKDINVLVEVSFDEKVNGVYETMMVDGKSIVEKREITFRTDRAPDHIPIENIAYTYPVMEQRNFYPAEYGKGYIKMITPQNYLFESGFDARAEFVSARTNQGIRTNLSYDRSTSTVFYEVPKDLQLDSDYELNLMFFPPGTDIQTKIIREDTEILLDQEKGETNWFDPSSGIQDSRDVSGSTIVSNKKATQVTVVNMVPKSILEYTFKTSRHASFKEKVKELKITKNLTNFILADVHSLSLEVADHEPLEKLEAVGGKYTNSKPLVYAQAVLDDAYYKEKIHPLLYKNYPLDGNIRVDREEAVLGIPPKRAFYIGNEYLAYYENQPDSHWVRNRLPFIYNLPYQYKADMIYLRNSILNKYLGTANTPFPYEQYKYLLENAFPPLPKGSYKADLIYRTPGDVYQNKYRIKYKND